MLPCVKRKAIVILLLWTAGLLPAASIIKSERLPMKSYTTGDGLGHNNVQRIVRDSLGFLWFCTFEGLSRFDGYSFTTFGTSQGLPSEVINDLLETRDGEYWVATDAGLCYFNPQGIPEHFTSNSVTQNARSKAMFTVYVPGNDAKSKKIISLLQDHAGNLWCGTVHGLCRLDQQSGQIKFRFMELGMPDVNADVTTIIEDHQQTLWVGSISGLYRLLPDGRTEHYTTRNGLLASHIHCLLEDREGRLWATTRLGGLCRLVSDPDPSREVVARLYTTKDGLPGLWINQIFQASDGTIWAGCSQGLIRFLPTADGKEFRFRTYDEPNGLSAKDVQALAEDSNGNLWVGMGNGGAVKLAHSDVTAFREADGIQGVTAIFKDKMDDLYVATASEDGKRQINRFDGERFTAIQLNFPGVFDYGWGWNQTVLQDHTGDWWIATGQGLYRFPKRGSVDRFMPTSSTTIYTTRDGLSSNTILRLFEDSRGDIWIGTANQHGLSCWERATQTFHHYKETDGLPSLNEFYPISFAEDRTGALWIGFSVGGGLVRYRDGHFTHFDSTDGVAEGGIFNLFIDSSGRLWIPTTRGGICRVDHPEAERLDIQSYTVTDGLLSNDVRAVTEDRRGRIYLGTGRGIDRLNPATSQIRHYTPNEGALLGDVLAALTDRDGALWFSFSVTGLVRLVPEVSEPPAPPRVRITGLRISGEAQSISAVGETEIRTAELSANQSNLQIDFVAPGFGAGEGLRYQYILQGTSQDWSLPEDGHTVNFANLAAGRYRFLVQAVNADGVLSPTVTSVSFAILPPVWQRWWFAMLIALLVGNIAYQLYRYRVTRLLEMERVRTRIAADLHDDIGSGLSRIAILSEVIKQQVGASAGHFVPTLTEIAESARGLMDSMRDIVWAIDPRSDDLSHLVIRIQQFATDVLESKNIEWDFHTPREMEKIKLDSEQRRHLFLIFKEAITNASRHANPRTILLSITFTHNQLIAEIRDDGRGFNGSPADSTSIRGGHGLENMQRRASELGGQITIDSLVGKGTRVELTVPLKKIA